MINIFFVYRVIVNEKQMKQKSVQLNLKTKDAEFKLLPYLL